MFTSPKYFYAQKSWLKSWLIASPWLPVQYQMPIYDNIKNKDACIVSLFLSGHVFPAQSGKRTIVKKMSICQCMSSKSILSIAEVVESLYCKYRLCWRWACLYSIIAAQYVKFNVKLSWIRMYDHRWCRPSWTVLVQVGWLSWDSWHLLPLSAASKVLLISFCSFVIFCFPGGEVGNSIMSRWEGLKLADFTAKLLGRLWTFFVDLLLTNLQSTAVLLYIADSSSQAFW